MNRVLAACMIVGLGLTACGGTSSTGNPASGAPAAGAYRAATPEELALAADALAAINAHRAGRGQPPLTPYGPAGAVAHRHSWDMNARNYFDHTNPDGMSPDQRMAAGNITQNGMAGQYVGENLAFGFNANLTGQAAVNGWIASPGHYAQIIAPQDGPGVTGNTNPAWTHCDLGVWKNGNYIWWTAVFLRTPAGP